jgi:hypothetical protein
MRCILTNSRDMDRGTAYAFLRYVLEHSMVLFSWLPPKSVAGLLGFEDQNDQKMVKELCTL